MKRTGLIIIVLLMVSEAFIFARQDLDGSAQQKISMLAINISTGQVAVTGDRGLFFTPRPLGSLSKLLLIAAAPPDLLSRNPVFNCPPSSVNQPASQNCWYRPGHGDLNLEQALAHSCNVWFRSFAGELAADRIQELLSVIVGPRDSPADFHALTGSAVMSPAQYAAMAAGLFNNGVLYDFYPAETGITSAPVARFTIAALHRKRIHTGLALSASEGTASHLRNRNVLAKTGTTWHVIESSGDSRLDQTKTDGLCLILAPAEKPHVLVLCIYPGHTGTETAASVDRNWHKLEALMELVR